MFIRRTQTRRTDDGKPYFSHRLVRAERLGNAVRQRTLLNLGRHFDIPQAHWPLLCARVADALAGQAPLGADCPPAVDQEAQRIAAQLVARGAEAPGAADVQPVNIDSLRLVRPRSVGVEQVGLWALEQVGLPDLLTRLGVNGALRAAAVGLLVGRLAQPASERATHRWLQQRSGLGELLGVDFETVVVALVKVRFSGRVSTDFLDEVGGVVVKRHSKLTPRRHRILTPKKGRKCIVWMPPQGGLGSFRSGALASRQARAGGPIAPAAEVRAGLRRSPA